MEHPEITWIERTGYPSWMQERQEPEWDEDRAFEERNAERPAWGVRRFFAPSTPDP